MPVDEHGTRADVIMDGDSIGKRMNTGCLYEQFVNSTSDHVTREVKHLIRSSKRKEAWEMLQHYYDVASPLMGELTRKVKSKREDRDKLLDEVFNDKVRLWIPPNSPNMGIELVRDLNREFPTPIGPVTYQPPGRPRVTTKENIRIGGQYVLLLEKNGNTWAAVASAKRQHFGILAKLTNADKYALPWRKQPVRFLGESEIRLLVATIGTIATAELLDQPNSPQAQREIAMTLLMKDKPSALKRVLDRERVPRGLSRSLMYTNHLLNTAGTAFTRGEDDA